MVPGTSVKWKLIINPFLRKVWEEGGLQSILNGLGQDQRQRYEGVVRDVAIVAIVGAVQEADGQRFFLLHFSWTMKGMVQRSAWRIKRDKSLWSASLIQGSIYSQDLLQVKEMLESVVGHWPATKEARSCLFRQVPFSPP
jgi:hypothetical protein